MSSQYTSFADLEGAIEQETRALAAETPEGAPAPEGAASGGDSEFIGSTLATMGGVLMHIGADLVGAMAGTGPSENARDHVAAGNSRAKTDALTGRPKGNSSFLWAAPVAGDPVQKRNRGAQDIMSFTKPAAGIESSIFATAAHKTPANRNQLGQPKTAKGLDLQEGIALSGQSLTSPTKGLQSPSFGVISSARIMALQGLLELRAKPTEQMAGNDLDNPYLTASRFAMPEAAQQRIELTAGISAPKPQAPPAPAMSRNA